MKLAAAVVIAAAVLAPVVQDPRPDPAVLHKAKLLSATTEHHTRLQQLLGEWNVVVRTTLPGVEAREDRGTLVAASILGGRHLVLSFTLELQGAKFEAVQILGFDTLRQVYTASWRDSLSTWAVDCSGAPSSETPAVLSLSGTLADARDPTGRPFRLVLDLGKDKAVTARTFETIDGKEVEVQSQQWTKR
jgi:hypothetical protein